jgi:hypothetical protein
MSPSPFRTVPSAWRSALIGALASLPVTVLVNWLPDSEADIAGGIILFGAFIAGVVATLRSTGPDAAGSRAGLLSAGIGILTPAVAAVSSAIESTVIAWPSPSRMVIFVVSGVLILVLAPAFGWVCGRIGGWVATAVTTRWTATPS